MVVVEVVVVVVVVVVVAAAAAAAAAVTEASAKHTISTFQDTRMPGPASLCTEEFKGRNLSENSLTQCSTDTGGTCQAYVRHTEKIEACAVCWSPLELDSSWPGGREGVAG
ncbi:hypothetical protein ElyMa_001514800 [Elysia marginata]|uniref:Secreted protein n=1 Tax=Elysia marginata TaxID=1093978 RepID=A0AAV4J727_9GAST|nr:hypothetical protein ElyMa_001514800 [Elysia marginata]